MVNLNCISRFAAFGILATLVALSSTAVPTHSSASAHERVITFDTFVTDQSIIALTFDVTFDRGDGEQVLDTLRYYGVPATFAITGFWARANPDLMQRIVNEGHTLINHTWDHPSFTGEYTGSIIHDPMPPLSSEEIYSQLRRTEELVEQQTGVSMRPYVRPPYGDYDDRILGAMADAGYTYNIMWTVDTFGWHESPVSVVQSRTFEAAQPGANILMHIGHGSTDGAALPGIIEGLRNMGYGFATVHDFVEGSLAPGTADHLRPDDSSIRAAFIEQWRGGGGLLAYGYPLTGIVDADGIMTQLFERAAFELYPDFRLDPLQIDVAGRETDEVRTLLDSDRYASARVSRVDDGRCTVLAEADVRVCGRLRDHWDQLRDGGIASDLHDPGGSSN